MWKFWIFTQVLITIAPDYFSLSANPWYYIVETICLFFAIRGFIIYEKLPEKEEIIKATGKKPFLK